MQRVVARQQSAIREDNAGIIDHGKRFPGKPGESGAAVTIPFNEPPWGLLFCDSFA
jgi:hypothetical protein